MTIPPLSGSGSTIPPFRVPVLTAPVNTGVPPIGSDEPLQQPRAAPNEPPAPLLRDDAPISLAGRLDGQNLLPDTTQLALALESATRAIQNGRPEVVLSELDAIWSNQLAADSPWYLRTAALQLLGRMTDAEQVMRDAFERLPRSAALLYLLGVHTSYRGHSDAARLANDHALALHPTEPLLWLQRAALESNSGNSGTAASLLDRVLEMEPAFPPAQWLTTLVRLGGAATRSPTPVVQRALERLTPSSLHAIGTQPIPAPAASRVSSALDAAVKYGLTLLESPTQSARSATNVHAGADPTVQYAEMQAQSAPAAPIRREASAWEPFVLVTSLTVLVFVPPLRIPALMLSGAMTMLLVARRLR